jgi:hypothetical protein
MAKLIFFNMIRSFSCFGCDHISIEEEFQFSCPQPAFARNDAEAERNCGLK